MKAVNLVPREHRRATASGEREGGAYGVLGVLAVLLVMAVLYVLSANGANENSTKAAEARQEADALEAQAAKLSSFTDFSSIKDQRLAAVMAAAETRFDWERLMREVSHVMPPNSWLHSTEASATGDANAAAGAPSVAAATGAMAGPSATFVGCTPKQSEVAKILVRLGQMHRVTDVTLNESLQEQGTTDVTVDSCGAFYKFDVTVAFAPALPSEAPRGSNSVPASLGGGS
jgi:Tfp pilus assembly protein PilN